jgi:DNA-directed RNA polymerase specialized sigma24 family protein
MATVRELRSSVEFSEAIENLDRAEEARLRQLASGLAYFGNIDAGDLLQEAITRGISGARKWPKDVSLIQFLAMTMRSIVDGELKKARRRPQPLENEVDGGDQEDTNSQGFGQRSDDILINREERARLLAVFEGDDVAQLVVEGMLDGMEGGELRNLVGLDPKEYASKRRAIRRAINRTYHARKKDG